MGRFYRPGVTKYLACPTVAGASPTRAELAAGVPLTGIAATSGFQLKGSPMETPDLDSRFVSTVPGDDKASDCSITFWDADAATDARRTALAKDTKVVIVVLPYGDVPTRRCEVWRVTSTGVNDAGDVRGVAQFMAEFSVDSPPKQDAVVPAAGP